MHRMRGTANADCGATRLSRRAVLGGFAASAAPGFAKAAGYIRGAGDIRRIRMRCRRTGESIDAIYWIEGEYVRPALREIDHFMRDWRTNRSIGIDPRIIDIMAASHNLLDAEEPYELLSGYRTRRTNAMLRRVRGGTARNSLHISGQAADLQLASRSVSQVARAARTLGAGGVGMYSRSNFVHMDCGSTRYWGR